MKVFFFLNLKLLLFSFETPHSVKENESFASQGEATYVSQEANLYTLHNNSYQSNGGASNYDPSFFPNTSFSSPPTYISYPPTPHSTNASVHSGSSYYPPTPEGYSYQHPQEMAPYPPPSPANNHVYHSTTSNIPYQEDSANSQYFSNERHYPKYSSSPRSHHPGTKTIITYSVI